jgi:hypothetical protein
MHATKIRIHKIMNNKLTRYLEEKKEYNFEEVRKTLNRNVEKVMDKFERHKKDFKGVEDMKLLKNNIQGFDLNEPHPLARRIQYITKIPSQQKIQRYIRKYEEEIQEKKDKFKKAWYQEKKKFIEEEKVIMNKKEYKERKKCGCGDDNFW